MSLATYVALILLAVALVVSLLVNWVFRSIIITLSEQNERLERSIDGLNQTLIAKNDEVKRLERESVPIVAVPSDEQINSWLEVGK